MRISRPLLRRLAALGILGGTCFQFAGCPADVLSYVRNFNPCGTILNCNPGTYAFISSGYKGPGANPKIDPACTFPPFCNVMTPGSDPFSP